MNPNSSTVHKSQDTEATLMSIDGWMDEEEVVHIYSGILPAIKKWKNDICHNVDGLEIKFLSEVRERQMCGNVFHLYVEYKKRDTNDLICKT